MEDSRDYAGMYEIEPGVFVQRVHVYENDARFAALEAKLDAILDRLELGIKVQTVVSVP